jgi:perosamine synthetase
MFPVFEPIITKKDITSVVKALKAGEISGSFGENIINFEKNFAKYIKSKYAIAVSSGTTALHLAVAACEFPVGSEILISATTNIATALAVAHNNCTPVPVDANFLTWNIDPMLIEKKITKKTKAIIVVHFLGNPVDMKTINKIAKKFNIKVIEDAAEAHGAITQGKKVGNLSLCGCFSLYANKVITSGEGGIITTNNRKIYEKIKLLRNLAFAKPRFKHFVRGYNFRMTGYQAALANSQLNNINSVIKKKNNIYNLYKKHLSGVKGIVFQKILPGNKSVYWMVGVLLISRLSKKLFVKKLEQSMIETRSFFMSMRQQPCLKEYFKRGKNLTPVSNLLWNKGLYLPSSHNLSKNDIIKICNVIKKILK